MFKRLAITLAALLVFCLSLFSCGKYYSGITVAVKSPDSRIEVNFGLKELPAPYLAGENMYYKVMRDGKELITDSPLGLNFGNQGSVFGKLVFIGVKDSSGVDDFDTPFSKQSHVRVEYKQITVTLREKTIPAKTFNMIFRVYNEGVAFRYNFREQEPKIKFPSTEHVGFMKEFVLTDEYTGFKFPSNPDAYATFYPALPHNYEKNFAKLKIFQVTKDSLAALPFLVVYEDGTALCISEADLRNYTTAYLAGSRDSSSVLHTVLWPLPGEKEAKFKGTVPFSTPWRVLMIADSPGKLIESNLILALSEPSRIGDVSWIKPGKASWDWWSGQVVDKRGKKTKVGGCNTETYKFFIDFAAEAHLEYCLIDAGWYGPHQNADLDLTVPDSAVDMPYLIQYANSQGVKLILWINWENLEKQIDKVFPAYEQWGIAGVKIDYMDRDDAIMIDFYNKVVELAAQHHLVVDFHGAYKPTGLRRTWPNLLTREAVIGMEYCKWSDWANPEHNVTIPYTRMPVGPLDYTPGAFNNATRKSFTPRDIDPMSLSTRCQQLAMYVVYESPLQMLSDSPVNYRKAKGLDFLSRVPTVWDETRFLQGEVGQYIVLARKKGDNWYLGAMTGWDGREIEVPLDFLGGGRWKATLYADGKKADTEASDIEISAAEFGSGDKLPVRMASGGGLAAVFEPVR